MSFDIYFNKEINLTDIENQTDFDVVKKNDSYWLLKDNNGIYLHTHNNDDECYVDGLTSYGLNSVGVFMDDLVLKFQLKFITFDQIQEFSDKNVDSEKIFNETTIQYGYKIDENGKISK